MSISSASGSNLDEGGQSSDPELQEDPIQHQSSSGSEEFRSLPNSPEQVNENETGVCVAGIPPRQEAKKVCRNISKLLRDKKSSTRGSRMFRKRRKRSERFAIIGYGTQPVEEEDTDCSVGRENTDSVISFGSTDDEILAYDRPGPDNVLERESRLSAAQQIIHNQHKHLAMDAVQMKGKGAKLFARRQRRMEKYVIENKPEQEGPASDVERCQPHSNLGEQRAKPASFEMSNGEERGFTPVSFNNIHSCAPKQNPGAAPQHPFGVIRMPKERELETSEDGSVDYSSRRRRSGSRTRPTHRKAWEDDGKGRFASADWSTDDESADRGRPMRTQQSTDRQSGFAYRKVQPPAPSAPKPPIAPPLNLDMQRATKVRDIQYSSFQNEPNSTGSVFAPPTPQKTWRSVKFQPNKARPKTPAAQSPQVAYPLRNNTENLTPKQKPSYQKPTPVRVWSRAPATKTPATKAQSVQSGYIPPKSPSVALLKEPLKVRSPSPFKTFENISSKTPTPAWRPENLENQTDDITTTSVLQNGNEPAHQNEEKSQTNGEVILPIVNVDNTHQHIIDNGNETEQEIEDITRKAAERVEKGSTTPNSLQNTTAPAKSPGMALNLRPISTPIRYQPSPVRGISTPSPNPDQVTEKPKIAACLKLLDPSKGRYEPKMELVYKQTPTLGAVLDGAAPKTTERPPSRNSYVTQQFNKPTPANQGIPPSSYSRPSKPRDSQMTSSKPLGAIAGGLKGKGARIFEKQQQRMEQYTKECNGNKKPQPPPELQPSNYRKPLSSSTLPKPSPGTKTRENMGQVLGEFRKVSDSDSPKRPSAHRKGRSKDPFHYQNYYVARRPPSAADFVCTDDAMSDTNSATSSLTSSYDMGSTCSSRYNDVTQRQNDDVRGEVPARNMVKGPPPRVAPKPKIERFLSSDSNPSVIVTPVAGEINAFSAVPNGIGQAKELCSNVITNGDGGNTGTINGGPSSTTINGSAPKPAFSVWSPAAGTTEPQFPDLPPPPSYHEVSPVSAAAVSRPRFDAKNMHRPMSNGVVTISKVTPGVTVAKPRFIANKAPTKWQPS
ncbi:uncharacterized protein LOC100183916 isoform X3 [Ciona intestinalis]